MINIIYFYLIIILLTLVFKIKRKRKEEIIKKKFNLDNNLEFSFSGCSWGCLFYIGCIKAIYEKKLNKGNMKIICCSSGCLMGIALLLNTDINILKEIYEKLVIDCSKYSTPIGHMSKWYKNAFDKIVKNDESVKKLNNKLTIVYTKFPSMKYVKINKFKNKEDLKRKCLASSFIPFYFTDMIFEDNQLCLDGGFINNFPKLSENTITLGVTNINKKNNLCISNSISVNRFGPTIKNNQNKVILDGYNKTISFLNKNTIK